MEVVLLRFRFPQLHRNSMNRIFRPAFHPGHLPPLGPVLALILALETLAFGDPSEVSLNTTPQALPILPEYRITTFAGNGTAGAAGDGGPAIQAQLEGPRNLGVDSQGNVYIADLYGERIRKVATDGTISTLVNSVLAGFGGDGGPVSAALFGGTRDVAADSAGNIYISDVRNDRIRRIDPNGIVSTFAGSGAGPFGGDGGPATQAKLYIPLSISLDPADNLYFADTGNDRIRKVDTNGIITTIAGTGTSGFSGDNGPATNAQIICRHGLAVDRRGNVYFSDQANHRLRKISTTGVISTIAGDGKEALGGGGGPATAASLKFPDGVAVDHAGNLFVTDNARIRRIDTNGVILTVAGGQYGFSGDGGPALQAGVEGSVFGLALLPNGDLIFSAGNRVRRLSPTGNTVPVFRKYASLPPPGSVTDFGTKERNAQQAWPTSVILIDNPGTASLTIQSVELLGDTSAFEVTVQDRSYNTLSLPCQIPEGNTGEDVTISIQCIVPRSSVTTNTATLRIRTNDPENPVVNYPLHAAVIGADNENLDYEGTLEETFLILFLVPRMSGASVPDPDFPRSPPLRAHALPEQATLSVEPSMPRTLTSELPSFLGGGSVVISNFTGRVTVSTQPISNDADHRALIVESGTFTAPSFLLPNGIATGPNTLTFGPASQSDGLLNLTNGNYIASASATIVNDLFPNGFPVQGTYRGTFDFALGQASVRSRSTDLFVKSARLDYLRTLSNFLLSWNRPGILEVATNILGPWSPRSNAVSPHSIDTAQSTREFFRLRSTTP
jgi:sugar lactone lactonase YvrE